MVEPVSKPFPVRPGASFGRTIGSIRDGSLPIFIFESVLEEILDYSESDLCRELGGFLVGGVFEDERKYIEIRHFLPATDASSNVASLKIDYDVWSQLHRRLEQQHPNDILVGWHHTHPGHGVFLSGYDRFIHRNYFDQPWHVAMVVDPKRQEFCFFQWQDKEIAECGFVCVSED